jgi:hypothetical protein
VAEFIFTDFPDGDIARLINRPTLLERLRKFIPAGEKARIREIGGEWGPWRRESEAIDRIEMRIDKMGVGPRLVVQRQNDMDMRAIRELSQTPNLGAAPELEKIHGAVWQRYNVRSGGLYLCRYIDGTRTVSKHGYRSDSWKGAAEDVFVNAGGMTELVKVGRYIADQTKAHTLEAATVIVDNDIWQPSTGWKVYGGQRHYHVHVDVLGGTACSP